MEFAHFPLTANHPEHTEKWHCGTRAQLLSIEPWNTGTSGAADCEDMLRKSIDIRLTEYPVQQKRRLLRPFPVFWRGRVRAEPENRTRDGTNPP